MMNLAAAIGFIMLAAFVVIIFKRWLNPFAALILCPAAAGLIYCLLSGQSPLTLFDWIYDGVFFAVGEDGDVSAGTTRSALMVLFACTYFTIMMQVGLFDPMIIRIIKLVNGDPLKIVVASTLVAACVSLDGDGTTTVLITTAAFMPLYKQFGIKSSYLALLIALPTSIFNMAPWGGPLARVLSALDLDVSELFPLLLPGMAVVLIYNILLAWFIGKKEQKRLGYDPKTAGTITAEELEAMTDVVRENNKDLKRPKLIWFNLAVTIIIMYMLIFGMANSALLFMIGISATLLVNYGFNFKVQRKRLNEALAEGLPACSMIVASGFLMGVLNGSGMANSIAVFLGEMIPASAAGFIPLITALLGIPGLIFLGGNSYYFGILPVLASLAASYGISHATMGVAAMVPLSTSYATPLIAWLYVLCERCQVDFGEYQKGFLKVSFPAFVLYVLVFAITGAMPL